ncbi:hypothetical protein EFD55_10940 [Rhizobium pisi]|uniref:Uncharacterized protein n=1 Tax=Rhizobium pisi TaxID=574561 RepID=A0A3R9AHZ0_9HYPH|nr:hypothetical protein EFD55_10940 [Rhizobium pisi]
MRKANNGFYSVIDVTTGAPAEVDATSIQLTHSEAEDLLTRLRTHPCDSATVGELRTAGQQNSPIPF